MYTKKSGRTTYKTSRRPSFKKPGGYSNSKGRNRGNVSQQYNKYLKLAKEAFRSGDRIQSEYYYQFTDHYFRLMVELGINVEENLQNEDSKEIINEDRVSQNQNNSSIENEDNKSDENNDDNNEDSIESIPFIAEPSKEKRNKSNK